MELDRAIRIINYDIDENASKLEQLEAFKVFFKELFDTDIQNSDGGYKSAYDIFLEASKKFHSKTREYNNVITKLRKGKEFTCE